jgi:hypothetical protein
MIITCDEILLIAASPTGWVVRYLTRWPPMLRHHN